MPLWERSLLMTENLAFKHHFYSPMLLNDLITSFNKAEEAENNGNVWTMEAYSNKAFRVLDNIRTKLLFTRVNGFIQHGEFRKAYAAAEALTKTKERKQGGAQMFYILMKEKRYMDLIELYNTFALREENEDWIRYMFRDYMITELRQQAMEKLEEPCKIDFMEILPQEIVALILDQLDFQNIVNCLQVSKGWRHHICNSSARSRQDLILGYASMDQHDSFSTKFFKSSVRRLSEGVRSLTIHANKNLMREVPDMLTDVPFNNLRALTIENAAYLADEEFKNLLLSLGHSLEEIYVLYSALPLYEILDVCPNLKRLHYKCTASSAEQSHLQLQHPSLTYLYIDAYCQTKELMPILQRAINLEEITIVNSNVGLDMLYATHQYGSKELRHICINQQSYSTNYETILDGYNDSMINTPRFDYSIDIHNCHSLTATSVLQLLNNNVNMKEKIEAISFTLEPDSLLQDWSSFKYFTSPSLRFIRFSFTEETEDIFATVIRNCPTLEEVSIFRLSCAPSNITMNALKTLPALQCFALENAATELYIEEIEGRFVPENIIRVNDIIIRQFFTYHALLGNDSTLKEVRLRHISNLEPATFEMLFKVKSLKSLNFAGLGLLNKEQDFGSVITGKEGSLLPIQLENLVLEDIRGITDHDLQFMDFPTIMLARMKGWTLAGIKAMLDNAEKVKQLRFYDCGECRDTIEGELKDTARIYNIQIKIPTYDDSFIPKNWTNLVDRVL